MQGIYTYIPEKNNVPKEYNVAAILSLLFMVAISLDAALALMYFYISTFRSMCAVPNMASRWLCSEGCNYRELLTAVFKIIPSCPVHVLSVTAINQSILLQWRCWRAVHKDRLIQSSATFTVQSLYPNKPKQNHAYITQWLKKGFPLLLILLTADWRHGIDVYAVKIRSIWSTLML
jgi:hypothetical protein